MSVILVCFLIRLLYTVFQPEATQKTDLFFFLRSIPCRCIAKKQINYEVRCTLESDSRGGAVESLDVFTVSLSTHASLLNVIVQ